MIDEGLERSAIIVLLLAIQRENVQHGQTAMATSKRHRDLEAMLSLIIDQQEVLLSRLFRGL